MMIWADDLEESDIEDPTKYTVIRDTREKENHGWHWNKDDRCNGTIDGMLKTADYTLKGFEDVLAIERKANASELATNLSEKRFPRFLERFSKFKYAFLVAECSFQDIINFPLGSGIPKNKQQYVKMKGDILLRRIFEMQIEYGTNIIWAGNSQNAFKAVTSIFKRVYETR